ncbi:maleate cis-trans isomerase family protein [Gymnodinialimonas ceratoperidinii]|uniref:Asp/Glu racemase n=1 Tax=Gymnodinialimonas ceratoperidinii TaxID=2856823 RepID=A0A8F6TU50_9RHOB|nr:Asp/Glu racemase [Gymnodinialimonas ceratoperidinii]QXT38750.1 Asp/Glu racemase [Gymnodinialimonas ceratoperidinii]
MNSLPYVRTLDHPAPLGLVVLQADESLEHDFRRLLPEDAELLVTRIPSSPEVSPEGLAAMESDLTAAASLLPRGTRFSAVGFGCTSGAAQIGTAEVAARTRAGVDAAEVSDPVTALIAACHAMEIHRLALVSPYVEAVSARLMAVLSRAGIEISAFASFNEASEARVVRIAPASIADAARSTAAHAPCDAVFLSCTNLRTLDVIAPTERALGIPVLSSNLVLAWHMAQLAGLDALRLDTCLTRAAPA